MSIFTATLLLRFPEAFAQLQTSGQPAASADEVLVPGPKPLTHSMVTRLVSFFEWILDIRMPLATRRMVEDGVIADWRKGNPADIAGNEQLLQFQLYLEAQSREARDVIREEKQPEIVTMIRSQATDPAARALIELYDQANAPIAKGTPPLTRHQADAALELFVFMAGQLEGIPAKPTQQQKDAWAQRLAEGWPKLNGDIRKQFSNMPKAWAATRAGWNQMAESEREQIKKQFAQIDFIKELRTFYAKAQSEAGPGEDAATLMARSRARHQAFMNLTTTMYNSTITQMAGIGNWSGPRYTVGNR
jgi:hypothetical protein